MIKVVNKPKLIADILADLTATNSGKGLSVGKERCLKKLNFNGIWMNWIKSGQLPEHSEVKFWNWVNPGHPHILWWLLEQKSRDYAMNTTTYRFAWFVLENKNWRIIFFCLPSQISLVFRGYEKIPGIYYLQWLNCHGFPDTILLSQVWVRLWSMADITAWKIQGLSAIFVSALEEISLCPQAQNRPNQV